MKIKYQLLFSLSIFFNIILAQNQQNKWYFGNFAALDFMQNPPAPLLNSAMSANQGCASVADQNGNLLFYTRGDIVYNSAHAIMANGSGLFGDFQSRQPCLILQKPGSANLYFIFTIWVNGLPGGFKYSVVDMSLAAGQGSVITKNAPIYSGVNVCAGSITGARHCNGTDYWLVIHERLTNNFRAYQFTSMGINTTAVISSIGPPTSSSNAALMKVSSDASKLAILMYAPIGLNPSQPILNVLDFDNTTGLLSNSMLSLLNGQIAGLEFSIDGSKLYNSSISSQINGSQLYQWDLCAGSPIAIAASCDSISLFAGNLQLAANGKIYLAIPNSSSLAVINNPNLPLISSNFVANGQTLGGNFSAQSLPNFIKDHKTGVLPPFTHSLNSLQGCHAVTFTANLPITNCVSSNYSVTSVLWDFGDPLTGTLNVSSSINPIHVYSTSGTFTASLIFNYKCGSDTIWKIIQIPPPNIAVSWAPNCFGMASASVFAIGGVGPYTYTWLPTFQTGSVVSNLNAGTYSVTLTDHGLACKVNTVFTVSVNTVPSFSLSPSNSVSICAGSNTLIQISGNCNSYSVYPTLGSTLSSTNILFNPLSSQNYTILGSLNSCSVLSNYNVIVLSLPSPSILVEKNKVCFNSVLKLHGLGGITYSWEGPLGFNSQQQTCIRSMDKSEAFGIYTLQVSDLNGCKNSTTTDIVLASLPIGVLAGFKSEGCVPFTTDFIFKPLTDSSALQSIWVLNNSSYTNSFSYLFKVPGTYTIFGTLKDTVSSCTSKLSYLIEAYPKPKAQFYYQPDRVIENTSDPVIFTNSSDGEELSKWTWWYFYTPNISPSIQMSSEKSVSKYFPDVGNYLIAMIVHNKWNCADTSIKSLIVEEDYIDWVPNTFTPNEDTRNDQFLVIGRGIRLFNIQIFNRWGNLIFQSNDLSQGWDGNFMGRPAQDGIYSWILTTTSNQGQLRVKAGQISLLR